MLHVLFHLSFSFNWYTSSISTCDTHIFKMCIWVKLIVRRRAEADNLTMASFIRKAIKSRVYLVQFKIRFRI